MTGTLAHIFRHPIKGHGREEINEVALTAGATMPWDRTWAIAHESSKSDNSEWVPCANFSRGSKAPGLMGINAELDEASETLTLSHPDRPDLTVQPDRDVDALIEWTRPLMPSDRAQSARIVRVPGRGLTDSPFPSVSLASLSSVAALGEHMKTEISPLRFRMNFWIDGLEAWKEFDWIGKSVKIGSVVVAVRERTVRCRATTANPDTGRIDADTLAALNEGWGHQDLGVYAVVEQGGTVRVGDPVSVIQ